MDKETIEKLKAHAIQIRDEKGISANTATRIGNMILELIAALEAMPDGMRFVVRDLGLFDPEKVYIHGFSEELGAYVTDQVWYGGCCWQCSVYKSTPGLYPRFNNSEWSCVLGAQNVTLDIVNEKSPFIAVGAHYQTVLKAYLRHAEMAITEDEIGRLNVRWMRMTANPEDDAVWNVMHPAGMSGMELEIDSEKDFPQNWWEQVKVGFKCIIKLPSGLEVSAEYDF